VWQILLIPLLGNVALNEAGFRRRECDMTSASHYLYPYPSGHTLAHPHVVV
jgi:hypothetical protein